MLKNFLNHEMCRVCGGKCCQHQPGPAWPEDFAEPLEDSLRIALSSGKWAVDWYEGDCEDVPNEHRSKTLYVRPAYKGNEGKIFHAGWGGECCFLSLEGCELSDEARPRGCRALKPVPTVRDENGMMIDGCKAEEGNDKEDCCRAWKEYEELLYRVACEVSGEEYSFHDFIYFRWEV